MTRAEMFRQTAENCIDMAESAKDDAARKRFKRLAKGWEDIANQQAWLDGEKEPDPPKAAS